MRSPLGTHKITLNEVTKSFLDGGKKHLIFQNVSLTFQSGVFYVVVGASGSGKSSLLHLIAALDEPTEGIVLYDEKKVAIHERSKNIHFTSCMFQHPFLIHEITAIENVALAARIAQISKEESLHRAAALLKKVGLEEKATFYPHQLSGGQQQRVALARALVSCPCFLIADEPTGSLDERAAQEIVDLMLSFQKEKGIGIIVATHDSKIAKMADEVITMEAWLDKV